MFQLSIFLYELFVPSESEYSHNEQKNDERVEPYDKHWSWFSRKFSKNSIQLHIFALS